MLKLKRLRRWVQGWRKRELEDPVFGRVVWKGVRIWFAQSEEYALRIYAGEAGPTAEQRRVFETFVKKFSEWREEIAERLWKEYEDIRAMERESYVKEGALERFAGDFPQVATAAGIWKIAHLGAVEIHGRRKTDLALLYEMECGDPEHVLAVIIKNGKVVNVGKEG